MELTNVTVTLSTYLYRYLSIFSKFATPNCYVTARLCDVRVEQFEAILYILVSHPRFTTKSTANYQIDAINVNPID